jgi:hypothetical protein
VVPHDAEIPAGPGESWVMFNVAVQLPFAATVTCLFSVTMASLSGK